MNNKRFNTIMKVFARVKGNEKLKASWTTNGTQYATDSMIAYALRDDAIINGLPKLSGEAPKVDLENCFSKLSATDKLEMSVKSFKEDVLKYPYIEDKMQVAKIAYKDEKQEGGLNMIALDTKLLTEALNVITESDKDIITIEFYKPTAPVIITSSRFKTSRALLAPITNCQAKAPAYVFTREASKIIDLSLLYKAHKDHMNNVKLHYLGRIDNEIIKALKVPSYSVMRPIEQIKKLVNECEFRYTSEELEPLLDTEGHETMNKKIKDAGYEEINFKELFKKLEGKNEWDDFDTLEEVKEDEEETEEEEIKEEPKATQEERKAITVANNDHEEIITPKVEDKDTWKIDEYVPKPTFTAYLADEERCKLATFDSLLEAKEFLGKLKDKLSEIKSLQKEKLHFDIMNDAQGNIAYQENVCFEYVDYDDLYNTDDMEQMI